MPILSGDKATVLIRQLERDNVRLGESIIFTCSATAKDTFPGANLRLSKPILKKDLEALLHEVRTNKDALRRERKPIISLTIGIGGESPPISDRPSPVHSAPPPQLKRGTEVLSRIVWS